MMRQVDLLKMLFSPQIDVVADMLLGNNVEMQHYDSNVIEDVWPKY